MRTAKLRLGVSACLLGQKVRYDGQHKRDAFLVDVLGPFVEWIPVCPELELGMGVPREPVRLVGSPAAPRLVAERSGKDHTDAMVRFAAARVRDLEKLDLAGWVTKKDSPSCGLEGVRVHGARGGAPRREGTGLFVRVLTTRMPNLPVEEEGRLADPALRESFIERIFAYARWKAAVGRGMRRGDLVTFHTAHTLALMAHGPARCRALGALVGTRGWSMQKIAAYERGFMEALRVPATRGRHANVLQHMLGFFREVIPPADRIELAEMIADYARGLVPLVVPLTLFRHHVRARRDAPGVAWLAGQSYLDPHPNELMLRNRV